MDFRGGCQQAPLHKKRHCAGRIYYLGPSNSLFWVLLATNEACMGLLFDLAVMSVCSLRLLSADGNREWDPELLLKSKVTSESCFIQ